LCGGWIAKSKVPHPPKKALTGLNNNQMEKKLKIKKIKKDDKKNLIIFNLTDGKVAKSGFDGNDETRSQERSYWIMWDQSTTLNDTFAKWSKGKKKEVTLDSDNYRLRTSEFKRQNDDGDDIIAKCTWIIPVDLADDDDNEWD
jgi:hypothetical protein